MRTRIVVWVTLIVLAAAPAGAQNRGELTALQSLAAALPPGTFVEVRMKDGARFKGTLMQQLDGRVVVKPRTRVPVPAREIALADLESMSVAKQGMSPGLKVLAGIGVGVGAVALLAVLLIANSY